MLSQIYVGTQRLTAIMHLKNTEAIGLIRSCKLNHAIETARTQQCRVDHIVPVSGCKDQHAFQCLDAIHLGQHLSDYAFSNVAIVRRCTATRDKSINLVKEDDRRRNLPRLAKDFPQPLFTFTDIFRKQLRPFDGYEINSQLFSDGFGQQCLARSRWTTEQNSFGGPQLGEFVQILVADRPFDDLAQLAFYFLESADVVPAHVRDLDHELAQAGGLNVPERRRKIVQRNVQLQKLLIRK